jgi:hypothetical protein
MAERRTTYGMPDLLASGHGELLGPGRAQLPPSPLLIFDIGGRDAGLVLLSQKVANKWDENQLVDETHFS